MSKKQQHLPGMEPPHHEDIEDAADALDKATEKKRRAAAACSTATDTLVAAMRAHDLTHYIGEEFSIDLDTVDKVKIKPTPKDDADPEDPT